ncbi:hypothetical protein [Desulfurella sp.]|uniref:hypothetical protein n=1 Tax=Desulfurella sp. TaxID=1962857 RepID=UPI0025C5D425|nr:hypothetical protein [Desulfurella sp.]
MKQEIISAYLKRAKKALQNGFDFVPRQKNKEFLLNYGLNEKTLKQAILELTLDDYKEGPLEDKDKKGELWVFKISFEGIDNIYIKLKVYEVENKEYLKCISFHN